MKNLTKLLGIITLATVMGFSFTACDNQSDPTTYPNPATITQANGLDFNGKVTIKSSDPYTDAQWNADVKKVIAAFNAAYNAEGGAAQNRFRTVFSNDAGAQIVLVNNLANNWQVRAGEFRTLYLKTGSITTANYLDAVGNMAGDIPNVGKATSAKHRVFLATVLGTKNGMYAI